MHFHIYLFIDLSTLAEMVCHTTYQILIMPIIIIKKLHYACSIGLSKTAPPRATESDCVGKYYILGI